MRIPHALLSTLEIALNRALALDPDSMARIQRLSGNVVCLDIQGIDLQIFIAMNFDGIQLLNEIEHVADATIRGKLFTLGHHVLTKKKQAFFSGDIVIEGDMELGRQVQHLLNQLDIDWEEGLSHMLGDVAAHQLATMGRDFFSWIKKAGAHLAMDSAEFVQHEKNYVPSKYEVESFLYQVDDLRGQVDRLSQRVQKLRQAGESS
ncbi:MAG: SCP2 sterol-binding domain-containing protein [Gammaproteobacteria bacterium]|nr:SCP2 sterol-binding domain-containing protein [Gammaproteobacteria bacterium]MDH5728224.1 SCP2 sterol-binding domain-containing protein [Gammaproteobacteria bacterium]